VRIETTPPQIDGLTFVKPLGSGGYSEVYLYEMERPLMEVAVKVLNSDALSEGAVTQFTAEANAMAQLSHHPNIVQVFRADVAADGRPYIVMKYYSSPNYAERARASRFALADVLRVGIQVASAVETAHRAGILHRDIKPANILTDRYGSPGLTDFGIAGATEQSDDDVDGMSPPWAPPEVLYASGPADERSDIYSLGATLWHLLVGRSPFELPGGDNSMPALMRRVKSTPPPSTGRGDVPPALERLLQMAMAKSPEGRPSSAAAFARALQAVEQEQRLPLTPLLVPEEPSEPLRTNEPPGGDETRVRGHQSVDAQPVLEGDATHRRGHGRPLITSVAQPGLPSGDGRRPERQRAPAPVLPPAAGTVRRPSPISSEASAPGAPEIASRPSRRGLLVMLAVAIAVAAAAAVALTQGGGAGGPPTPTVVTPVPQEVFSGAPPGTPTVVARAAPGAVRFSWPRYANAETGDSFRWRVSGSGHIRRGATSSPRLTLRAASGASLCLSVQVLRAVGTAPSALSDPTCAQAR
jgi:serine/threonine protein kinase